VGGHFAFLALGRACGGNAMRELAFLDGDKDADALRREYRAGDERWQSHEGLGGKEGERWGGALEGDKGMVF
jgi:hypothetical protein